MQITVIVVIFHVYHVMEERTMIALPVLKPDNIISITVSIKVVYIVVT